MSDYTRRDGLIARTDTATPCRCGNPTCGWTESDDKQRDRIEAADVLVETDERCRTAAELIAEFGPIHDAYNPEDPYA